MTACTALLAGHKLHCILPAETHEPHHGCVYHSTSGGPAAGKDE